MDSFRRNRSLLIHTVGVLAFLCVLAGMPAMRHLGYPLAVASTAPAFFFGLWAATAGRPAVFGFLLAWLLFAVGVEPIWGCDTSSGLLWLLQGPMLAAAFAMALADFMKTRLGFRSWKLALACAAFVAADLLALGWRLYSEPQVMALDWIIGYVHGPIYDEWVPFETMVLRARAALLAFTAALICLTRYERLQKSFGWTMLFVVGVAAWPGIYLPSKSDLQSFLGMTLKGNGLVLHFHEGKRNRLEAERIRSEAEAHIAHLSVLTLQRPLPPEDVTIWLYPDAESKRRLIGAGNVLIARPWQNEIHLHPGSRPDRHLRHELVHALLAHRSNNPFGVPLTPLPNPALVEGMAVFLAPGTQRLSLHQTAAGLLRRGRLPQINELLSLKFSLAQGRVAYRAAGSLMQLSAQKYGMARLLEAYQAGSLQAAGIDTEELGRDWLSVLKATPDPPQARRNLLRFAPDRALLERACPTEVEAAWRFAQRGGEKRSEAQIEADYRAVMALSGDCRSLASLADRFHHLGAKQAQRRIEEELLARGIPSSEAARLFLRRADEATMADDHETARHHILRALAAAPRESDYRALLLRMLMPGERELLKLITPYVGSGKRAKQVISALRDAYPRLAPAAASAAAYLLMRAYGNQAKFEQAEVWGQRAAPLPRTLRIETSRYLAALAERASQPCLAAQRFRRLAAQRPAIDDRLKEILARLRYAHPATDCASLASP
jgi:hypothetical protein